MKTKEILIELKELGFNNWNHWTTKECAEYVMANFDCSRYVAKNVAFYIKDWR